MFAKLKSLTGEIYNISCPRNRNVELENLTIFHVQEVKTLVGELYYISCPRSGKM